MKTPSQSARPPFEKVFFLMAGSVLTIFTLAVIIGVWLFRSEARHQILQRDGILLGNISAYFYNNINPTGLAELDLIDLAYESSKIKDVIAVRVFSPPGNLVEMVPDSLYPVSLSDADLKSLDSGEPVIRFFKQYATDSLFSDLEEIEGGQTVPLVEVVVPVKGAVDHSMAAIQYWLDGAEVADEFKFLDQYLAAIGLIFILGGGSVFSIVFLYARNRLKAMARVLARRNKSLERANTDLAIAARTSAIGSITSHLFHDLKNPLAGLKAYLRASSGDKEAVAVADRMQSLIDETLMLLRDQDPGESVTLTLPEIRQLADKRLSGIPRSSEGHVDLQISGNCEVPLHKIQMVLLVLYNLADNAVTASAGSAPVMIQLTGSTEQFRATISDSGPGLPEEVRQNIFEPVKSSKTHGSGIGLAISSLIARQIPASLELLETSENGTTFEITIKL